MLSTITIIAAFIGATALAGGIAMLFRGNTSSEVEDRLEMLTGSGAIAGGKDGRPDERSVLMEPLDDRPGILEQFAMRFGDVNLLLEQAGVEMSPAKFVIISLLLAAVGAGGCLAMRVSTMFVPIVAICLGFLPMFWIIMKRKRRLNKFGAQLPQALELLGRALRAGHSLAAGFHLVGTEVPAPLGKEFARVYEEQNLGIPLDEALEVMTERVPNLDLRFFATAVILQRQTGGDLAEILDKIGHLVRERFKIFGQIQALTGEGRLSGIVLLGLPPALFAVMLKLNPEYVMVLFTDPMGKQMLAVALVLQAVGALVIRKIVNIKV